MENKFDALYDPKAAAFKYFFNIMLVGLSAHDLTRKHQPRVDDAMRDIQGEVKFVCYVR